MAGLPGNEGTSGEQLLVRAIELHQRGAIDEAERGYRRVLDLLPGHPYALNFLGLIEYQRGRPLRAVEWSRRAIRRQAGEARFHATLGTALRAAGRIDEAVASLRTAVSLEPRLYDAHNNLGIALRARGDHAGAAHAFEAAVAIDPANPVALGNLGAALLDDGRPREACTVLERALAGNPADAGLHYNHGNALHALGRQDEAEAAFRRALRLDAGLYGAWFNLGNALARRGRHAEAADAFGRVEAFDPGNAAAKVNRGNALAALGRHAEAEIAFRDALEIDARSLPGLLGRADALAALDRPAEALEDYRRLLVLDPGNAPGYAGLGRLLVAAGEYVAAVHAFDRAVTLHPARHDAHQARAGALWQQGRIDEAVHSYAESARLAPEVLPYAQSLAFVHSYVDGEDAAALLRRHRSFAEVLYAQRAPGPRPAWRSALGRPLRVGFVSPDLRRHSVSYFLEPLIAHLDPRRVEAFGYMTWSRTDEVSERLRARMAGFVRCHDWDDERLRARIEADGIDLLIDLAGLTAGNRLPVFAMRPAPVLATWLGYPTTTGLDVIDFRITDGNIDPEGAEAWSAERPLRLEHSHFCYGGPGIEPDPGPPPSRARGHVTFGSFNNLAKLSPATVSLWASVLRAVAGSRLALKSRALVDARTREVLRERFAAERIGADRLDLAGWREGLDDHLAAYREIDIALDPIPYNGATSTCEALWMGVPVITLCGDTHPGRMGRSLLNAAGLHELVARDRGWYVKACAMLAGDAALLEALRRELRPRLRRSPLMDGPGFARRMEQGFDAMWREITGEARA